MKAQSGIKGFTKNDSLDRMKGLFFCIMILWSGAKPFEGFGQSRGSIDSINKVIGPNYSVKGYVETINVYGGKQFVFMAEGFGEGRDMRKIFVLKKEQNKLTIFDSSAAFECVSTCGLVVKGDSIIVGDGFSHGSCELIYKLDPVSQKFALIKLKSSKIIETYKQGNADGGAVDLAYIVEYIEAYDVLKQELRLESVISNAGSDSGMVHKEKIIQRKMPNLKTSLKGMKEPQDHGEVFNYGDDKVYKYMTSYTIK